MRAPVPPALRRTPSPAPSRPGPGRYLAVALAALLALWLVPGPAVGAPARAADVAAAADQVLTWTGDNSVTKYKTAPATATAGAATIVFENSRATGNTIAMSHTLTFDTSTPGYNHDVTVDILANPLDAQGGRHEVEVTLTPGTYRYFCAIPGHGSMVGELVVTGGGGGEEDTTAPTVTAEVTGETDADGAYLGSASVALTAEDTGSGVASVEYALDGGEYQAYSGPVVVDEVGEHTMTYRATDVAGNVSEVGTTTFTVVEAPVGEDTTPPTVTAEVTGQQDGAGAYVGSATVTLTATDEGSGVAVIEYSLDGGPFTPYEEALVVSSPGSHTVAYRATDGAGNTSAAGEVTVVVAEPTGEDTVAPTVSAEVAGEQDAEGSYVGAATVSLTAEDAGSGVASVEYALDGGEYQAYTEAVVVDEVGQHTMVFRATDEAGNVSEEGSVTFTVVAGGEQDTTAPVVLAEVLGDRDARGAYVGAASVTLTGVDEGPGEVTVEYSLHAGHWMVYDGPVVVTELGATTLRYRGTDAAGNVSEEGSVTFSVVADGPEDTVAPTVTATVVGSKDRAGRHMGRATVSLQATDTGSGVLSVEYSVDGGAWQPYVAPVVVVAPGNHTFAHRATDRKGNVSAAGSVTFAVMELRRDMCPSSDTRPTVVIGGHDSTVVNVDRGDGCTVNDLVAEGARYASYQAFQRHVRTVTTDLVASRTITRAEKQRIVAAAQMSDVGRS
ncbi:copper binding plastocyanin/azurin family protein [Pseudokineococcus lusitanus]|uniref:Copper binding plastocyanin/azurin family protein n=1 Tax=Pseudokineococcus lusitanus TaxID=763993 RepID=A0A3N1HNC9_9ACTN|nr:plastocyanin/azurin family copper-binding protein [Pseudokineococcus lusitanus]ROP43959.1 copper binding plastocyanin/azurin family protein [Pseudokineococcus lusitanus]